MANILNNLAADLYKAADVVGRELTGAVSSVIVNGDGSERVALNDIVRSHFTRQPSASSSITPSMTIPEGTDQTVDSKTISITKAQSIQIPWTGEDIKSVNNGSGFGTIYGDQVAQAMRTLANEIEADLCTELYQNASRAFGTAGTTPFGSNFDEVAELRQILVDNGCPADQITMVLNTSAGTNLRNLANLQKVNESGGSSLLRQGVLLDLQGLGVKESAGIQAHTKGTGAGYLVNNGAGILVGGTTIAADTGAGTILAGDVVTFAADANNKFMVNTALGGGSFAIGENGAQVAIADNNAITVGSSYAANLAFRRTAAELVIRAPAVPGGEDQAGKGMIIHDPWSGLTFEVRAYKGYRKAMFEVACAWGVKAWKPEHIAVLLG